jgi:hypothetical protein
VVKVADGRNSCGGTWRSIHWFSGEIFARSLDNKSRVFLLCLSTGAGWFEDLMGDDTGDVFQTSVYLRFFLVFRELEAVPRDFSSCSKSRDVVLGAALPLSWIASSRCIEETFLGGDRRGMLPVKNVMEDVP